MRIAQVATLNFRVPPKLYGGIERVVSYLTEELVTQGHEVTLFASGDSETSAKLVAACPQALSLVEDPEDRLPCYVRMMELVFADVSRFDVIHFHTEDIQHPWLRRYPCPNVTTLHGEVGPHMRQVFDEYNPPLVSISDNQRLLFADANWQATIHHGLPRDLYTFRNGPGDYLAFLGRASHPKRLDRAIAIAYQAGMKLKVACKINLEEHHFKQAIEPQLEQARDWVEFIGQVGDNKKDEFLGNAHALLFPIDWAEPFGLVMIESLACGTPVIAWRNGSVPEVIDSGSTGFIVESQEEAVWAVGQVSGLSRQTCRQVFEDRFDAARMTRQYVEVYQRLIRL
ncbi:MAG TPA: glycosyltransferase family 4 protein [Pyrinomonadaceae bacterium]|jgi:glycosyltransferase involved in cell wall biosynthesis|nr:glycosyltransferase family 4 protein [Pyrinomonadaceae bacterium]